MAKYAVIVQNDESEWDDIKGDLYHYPSRYRNILVPGCKVIYYKGKIRDRAFEADRLSSEPHYFGTAIVGDATPDDQSTKDDWYCQILEYQEFLDAVGIRGADGEYLEEIPESKKTNYWRSGVREIPEGIYHIILSLAQVGTYTRKLPSLQAELESEGPLEGGKKKRYSSYYERNPYYRKRALEIHGLRCMVCEFDFEDTYGTLGAGFCHVHHNKPLAETGATMIDPENDMSVVCPNCHAMIHRKRDTTLTVRGLRQIIGTDE